MICELCGRKTKKLLKANIEGAELLVCEKCISFERTNKVNKKCKVESSKKKKVRDVVETIVDNFAQILRKYREERGLTQEEMAKVLGIKTSLYRSLEEGSVTPDIDLAKRIEKTLKLKLTTTDVLYSEEEESKRKYDLTVADVINLKIEES